MPRVVRFQVLMLSKIDFLTISKRTGLFERVHAMSCLAARERTVEVHCLVRSSALMTAASREVWVQRVRV